MEGCGKLLIVDDEVELAGSMAEYLVGLGHQVRLAHGMATAQAALLAEAPDLVLLDLGLGQETGLALLRELTQQGIGALVVTGQANSMERVICLEMGADDVLQKPFLLRELAGRVAGLLRRRRGRAAELLRLEHVSVDLRRAVMLEAGAPDQRLGHGEVALLRALAAQPGVAMSRDELLEAAPADGDEAEARSIDQRIARLRAKLRTDAIETLRGHGYRLNLPGG